MACDLAQARLKKGWGKLMARPGAWGKVLEKVLVVSGHVSWAGFVHVPWRFNCLCRVWASFFQGSGQGFVHGPWQG